MAEQLMDELEKAAQIILAAPNLVTTEQRHNAEEVFSNFRKQKRPYELCRQILETNTNDYIVFEAVGLIKIALIREWPLLSKTYTSSLRNYLLHYVMNKPNLPPYIERSILQLIAIMIKRGTVNNPGRARNAILEEIENLIITGDLPKKLLGCNLISQITEEYALDFKSAYIGLPWETHFYEKKAFQDDELQGIFKFCCRVIEELIKKDLEEDSITLLKPLLQILESIFTWTFVHVSSKNPMLVDIWEDENTDCEPLKMDRFWRRVMLVPDVIDLMFTLYLKIRENPQLAHHARTCLVQMVHVNEEYSCEDIEMENEYFIIYVEIFLKFIIKVNIIDEEACTIAHIFKKLLSPSRKRVFNLLPNNTYRIFLEQMSKLTCTFIENLAQEESLCVNECLYKEAVDIIFDAWKVGVIFDEGLFHQGFVKPLVIQIINTYLRCHLSPPEGIRNIKDKDLEEKKLNKEDTDMNKFKEHLKIIGIFGRLIPNYALPLLAQLIEDRVSKLREIFNKLVEQIESLHTMKNDSLSRLYKDIHWLVLIIRDTLCSTPVDSCLMSEEIIRYDVEEINKGNVDINLTSQFFVSSENISSMDIITESVDHVIRLVASIFRLCAIEKDAVSVLPDNILSPELCVTVTSFLHIWSAHYLFHLNYFSWEKSPTFTKCFGRDSPIAIWALNFLFKKLEFNINIFKSEPAVMEETIEMLISLSGRYEKAEYLLNTEELQNIINLATKGQHDLPQIVKRGLMTSVVQIGIINMVGQSYWTHTLQPLIDKFKQITSNEKFLQCYHQEEIKIQVTDILECFIGVAQGAKKTYNALIYHNIQPILHELPNLISLYHNYQDIQLILELLFECTNGSEPVIYHISGTDASQVSEIYLSAIRNYTRCNINRLTIDSTAEEDDYQDILFLMKLLTNILSKNILENKTVFLQGLTIIMPMMTTDLFKFPCLCLQYFEMMMSFCKDDPQKVLDLSSELLQPLLASIELGLFSFGRDVSMLCCNMIEILITQIFENMQDGSPKSEIMAPFLNLVFTVILTRQVDSYFISNVCISVYYLMHCYQDEYNQIVQNLLSIQSDEHVAHRLANAFKKLTEPKNFLWEYVRADKIRFKNSFDVFVANLQGFLTIK